MEDVGTFSVRGGILDVYCPLYARPIRIELFGDTGSFVPAPLRVPASQRTVETLKEITLVPARELIFNAETKKAAETAARAAAERIDLPSTKLREVVEKIRDGIPPFGIEALLPGFYPDGLASVLDYLPFWSKDVLVYVDDPVGVDRSVQRRALRAELERVWTQAQERGDLALSPDAHFVDDKVLRAQLGRYPTLEGGGLSLTPDATPPVVFSFGTTQDIRNAILSHHGEEGALTPLVERLDRWRSEKVVAVSACGTAGQVDRVKRLLLDRNLHVRVHTEPLGETLSLYDPAIYAHLFTGEVSQGFVDMSGGLAVLSDEEIFGARARRQVKTRKGDHPFVAAFRELKEGDLIVHTDFGIGRYQGLVKMQVQGVPGDFLLLEYAGRDKVYRLVGLMRLIQKFTGADAAKVTLDRLDWFPGRGRRPASKKSFSRWRLIYCSFTPPVRRTLDTPSRRLTVTTGNSKRISNSRRRQTKPKPSMTSWATCRSRSPWTGSSAEMLATGKQK